VNEHQEYASFTAENSIYKSAGRYCMVTAFDSQNAAANVQPAVRPDPEFCRRLTGIGFRAALNGNDGLAEFLAGVQIGAGCWD
jgi:hypothetical protein